MATTPQTPAVRADQNAGDAPARDDAEV